MTMYVMIPLLYTLLQLFQVTWMCNRVLQYITTSVGAEHIVSYLPLSHIATQLIDIYVPLSSAGTVWFAQPDAMKVNRLPSDML